MLADRVHQPDPRATRWLALFAARRCHTSSVVRGAALAAVILFGGALSACGGTTTFASADDIPIVGAAPEPEPPPPERVVVTEDAIVINDKILFDYNKATIRSESFGLLDEIVSVIEKNPRIKKISIEGHTDSDGTDEYNRDLSDRRAASVMKYLTEHGVDAGRLTSTGHGESAPIATNETDEGKQKNRRVEFLILEQERASTTYEIDPETGERREVSGGAQEGTR
jgi:OOP family OmpA-OmpF porin